MRVMMTKTRKGEEQIVPISKDSSLHKMKEWTFILFCIILPPPVEPVCLICQSEVIMFLETQVA